GRPLAARRELAPDPPQVRAGRIEGGVGMVAGQRASRTVVAPSTGDGRRIVEAAPQVLHPAAGGDRVLPHRVLLRGTRGGHPRVPFRVVPPWRTGRRPATGDPAYRAVDVEHLAHQLQPAAASPPA